MTLPDRFWDKTANSECVVWTGALNSRGYGVYRHEGRAALVHRVAWVDAHGEIPDGLTVDHLCLNRRCVNVDHLELVTYSENSIRKGASFTHCIRGHELARRTRNGGRDNERYCPTCENEQRRARYRASREAGAA